MWTGAVKDGLETEVRSREGGKWWPVLESGGSVASSFRYGGQTGP